MVSRARASKPKAGPVWRGVVRVATGPAVLVLAVSGCGAGSSSSGNAAPQSSGTARTVTSQTVSPRSVAHIDLRKVVLHAGPRQVVATFTTYNRLFRPGLMAPVCGQVGINFQTQDLSLLSSSVRVFLSSGETAVSQDQVTTDFLGPHAVRLTVPTAALGSSFNSSEPWLGFSVGYNCPPGGSDEDHTSVVTPRAG